MKRNSVLLVALLLLLLGKTAAAHPIGLSQGEYRRTAQGLQVELVFARQELDAWVSGFEHKLIEQIHVYSGPRACIPELISKRAQEGDAVRVRAHFRCPDPPARLTVKLEFLEALAFGHRHAAKLVSGSVTADELCFREHANFDVPALAGTSTSGAAESRSGLGFLWMGLEHILTGYDHLVFLFGLLLIRGRFQSLVAMVTAFTLAHSLTLALAVFGVCSPSRNLIEPAIALSIGFVGVENFFRKNTENRWLLSFVFGLVHGFGFAGALTEIELAPAELAAALFAFNGGVELGQLAVIACALPLLHLLQRTAWFPRFLVPTLNATIVIAGLGWCLERSV